MSDTQDFGDGYGPRRQVTVTLTQTADLWLPVNQPLTPEALDAEDWEHLNDLPERDRTVTLTETHPAPPQTAETPTQDTEDDGIKVKVAWSEEVHYEAAVTIDATDPDGNPWTDFTIHNDTLAEALEEAIVEVVSDDCVTGVHERDVLTITPITAAKDHA